MYVSNELCVLNNYVVDVNSGADRKNYELVIFRL